MLGNVGVGEGVGIPPPMPQAPEIAKPDSSQNLNVSIESRFGDPKISGPLSNSTALDGHLKVSDEAAQIEEAMKILGQGKHEASPPHIAEKKGIRLPTPVKIGFIGAALAALTTLWKSISQTFFGKKDSGGMFPSTA